MKTLKFYTYLVPLILSGEKTATWRLFDDKDLQPGDELELINKDTMEKFGEATITAVREKPLKNITDEDFDGHEKFESTEKMYETHQSFYGDKVTPETIVKMIRFRLK